MQVKEEDKLPLTARMRQLDLELRMGETTSEDLEKINDLINLESSVQLTTPRG